MIVTIAVTKLEIIPELNAVNLTITPTVVSGGVSVPTKTSQLFNDGSDGVHPFITAEDVTPLPDNIVIDANYVHTDNNFDDAAVLEVAKIVDKADLVDGVVPASQLPSYVDDIIEVDNFEALPTEGESGKIYITLDTNKTYRWSGTQYVVVSETLALGETSSTAHRGDRGKTAYDHSQIIAGNPHGTTASDVGAEPTLPYPEVPVGDVLSDDGTFVKITQAVGGFANNLYFSYTDSDIVGYKTLNYEPDELPATMQVSAGSADGDKLCCSFLYPSPVAVDEIPAGLWSFSLWAYISSIAGVSNVGVRYFKYSTLGVKTYVFPEIVWSKEINNTTYDWIPIPTVQLSIPVDPTDRMGCDTFMKTSTAATKTIYVNVGDGNASYLNNPNALRHKVLRAINEELDYQHIDQTTEKATPIDDDSLAIWDSVALKFVRTSLTNFKTFMANTFSKLSGGNTFSGTQVFGGDIKVTKIVPNADGTTAIIFYKADGTTTVMGVDSTNRRVKIVGSTLTEFIPSGVGVDLILESGVDNGISIQTNLNRQSGLNFGNLNDGRACGIKRNANTNNLYFYSGNLLDRAVINSIGYFGIKNLNPETFLDVDGAATIRGWIYQNNGVHTGDAIGDKRTGNVAGIQVTQTCTVANAVKGSGTWVTISAIDTTGLTKAGIDANYTEIGQNGVKLFGTATVFEDLTADITRAKTVGARITFNDSESTLEFTNACTLTDYVIVTYQMSHKWKLGSVVFPHIHWEKNSANTPNWLIQYRWQINGGTKVTAWTNYKCNVNAFTYVSGILNQICYDGGLTPPVGASLSDIVELRIIRDTANTSGLFTGADNYTGVASITAADIHYEIDTLGSNTEYVK